ncbi:MAG: hypothetical protein NWE88_04895 [Candidatus Bathyarchaeota archaeon]|nr:hypothetical protein [Candidatus Bathyarchaeota archaeon]
MRVVGVSFIVERRSGLKRNDPGVVAIPGGHVEEGEGLVEEFRRRTLGGIYARVRRWI